MFKIYPVTLENGAVVAIAPMPGRFVDLTADVSTIAAAGFDLVVTMTPLDEMKQNGAGDLETCLNDAGINWRHMPIADFGVPPDAVAALWPAISKTAKMILADGGKVLFHCKGGQGRSGMAALRLLIEWGLSRQEALVCLRGARTGAVETPMQMHWAFDDEVLPP